MTPSRLLAVSVCLLLGLGVARGADVPGSKDPKYFKRYAGSDIVDYSTRSYDQYFLARGAGSPNSGFEGKTETVEGAITRLIYRVPEGHTSLELLRNYEKMLTEAGFTQTFELNPPGAIPWEGYFYPKFLNQAQSPQGFNPLNNVKTAKYVTAKATKEGQDITVAVLVAECAGDTWKKPGTTTPVTIKAGEVLVFVDVITAKAVENKMVVIKSEEMAQALKQTGKIDVYGILFDVDKTEVKQESAPTLTEVAKLLKGDAQLKLEVAGHTDNTGSAAHNLTLSEGRAAAVVRALVSTYGVAAARLQAKGYGDTKPIAANTTDEGRAKNRRVELRKI